MMDNSYDTIVLSGASTKGFVILGSLQYLQDNDLLNNFQNIIGTSSGALIGYLLCIGYKPVEILVYLSINNIVEKIPSFNIVSLIQGNGATSFHTIYEGLEKMTIEKIGYLPTLKDIKDNFNKKLIITTYNITEDRNEYLSYDNYPQIPCLVALRMSSNLPLIFDHYRYGNSFYIDGGISDNFSIQLGDKIGNKIFGINMASSKTDLNQEISELETIEYLFKLLYIPVNQSIEYKIKQASPNCDILNLHYDQIKFFEFNINSKLRMEMFSSGYQDAKTFFITNNKE
jgi:NTE family protein